MVGASSTATASRSWARSWAPSRGAAMRRPRHHLEDRHVPHAVVAGAVVAGDPGPVGDEGDARVVQRGVHQDLVEGAVQEGRVDRHHRVQAGEGHAGRGGRPRAARRCRRRRSGPGSARRTCARPTGCSMAAVMPTTSSRSAPTLTISSANTEVQDVPAGASGWPGLRVAVHGDLVQLVVDVVAGGRVALALAGDRVHDHRAVVVPGPAQRGLHRRRCRGRRPGRRTSGPGPRTCPAGRRCPSGPSSRRAAPRTAARR